jgi:hypothetical protein
VVEGVVNDGAMTDSKAGSDTVCINTNFILRSCGADQPTLPLSLRDRMSPRAIASARFSRNGAKSEKSAL